MIAIKTNMKRREHEPLKLFRQRMAAQLAAFLPLGVGARRMKPVMNEAYDFCFLDEGNDWHACFCDQRRDLIKLSYRYEKQYPGREFAVAHLAVASMDHQRWEIIPDEDESDAEVRMVISVDMDVVVRADAPDEDDLETITLEIPIDAIRVFFNGKIHPKAAVVGFTTQQDVEVTQGYDEE